MPIDPRTGMYYDPLGEDAFTNMSTFRNPNNQLGVRGQNFNPSSPTGVAPRRAIPAPAGAGAAARPAGSRPALSDIVGAGALGSMDAGFPVNPALFNPQENVLPEVVVNGSLDDSPPPMTQAMAPAGKQTDPALWDALIQGGAGLLSGKNLKEGLAEGFSKFGTAYDASRKARLEEKLLTRPKIVPLADGAFSLVVDADGNQKVVKNEQVADYVQQLTAAKSDASLLKLLLSKQFDGLLAGQKADAKTAAEARPLLNDTQSMISRWEQAQQMIEGQGLGSQVAGAFPTIAGFFGSDEAAKNKFLEGLIVDETLLNTARTKGAISNQEMTLFKSPIPSLSDDRQKVWKPWIEQRLPVLRKLEQFYQSEVARGNPQGLVAPGQQPAPAPAAPSQAPVQLSPNSQRYFE